MSKVKADRATFSHPDYFKTVFISGDDMVKELADEMGDSVTILKVDVDKNQQLAEALRIQGVPTLTLFQSGEMSWRQSGVLPAYQLAQIIREKSSIQA